ncbi:ketoacyl-ACP synthase III [Paraburkholderia sp. Tr-20389]|uniref:3-oxoacyl-[acyl-carrier-protein] synthase III C-terminal domain-containing protein n=1 Tax=Paraburkholderia sp. Tr-20389 TaxID=2703903 RepID=UPI0019815870|nr:3-oxoacyl-[acyl-carrier-protein] synthase III C-terminal domain-containing protein [Paraburkholderia sp. Tr-20389]MBN3751631.1 ketoacyl-ACP synthase III [Paraburkholderia sp. Tr-20389]
MSDTTKPAILPVRILSSGKALPGRKVTSHELDVRLSKPSGWVQKRSGIAYRFHAHDCESQSDIAAQALHDAFANGGIDPGSIDLLISASGVMEQSLPSTASLILHHAGLRPGTPGFDVNASCFSFPVALHVAASLLNTSAYRRIAIVASDLASRGIDWDSAETSLIFGDGAAAIIVERGDGTCGIEGYRLRTYPEGKAYCEIRAGTLRNPRLGACPSDFLFQMDGKRVFRLAASEMDGLLTDVLDDAHLSLDHIDTVVPHQASHLGMRHVAERLRVPTGKIVDIYKTHGNQVAASIPTALHEAFVTGRAQPGRRVMLIGTAAGVSVGGLILKL